MAMRLAPANDMVAANKGGCLSLVGERPGDPMATAAAAVGSCAGETRVRFLQAVPTRMEQMAMSKKQARETAPGSLPPWDEWLNREREINARELELWRERALPETAYNVRERARAEIEGRTPVFRAGWPRG